MRVIRDHKEALILSNDSCMIEKITDINYYELVEILGKPTFGEENFDGKVQVEWVVEYQGSIFTIYDWKTFNREHTLETLRIWMIGGSPLDVHLVRDFKNKIKA